MMTELAAARDWLTVYQLPPDAHELNPVELVWSHLKRSLANLAKRNLSQLTALVKTRLKRMQYRSGVLDGFLASTGLDLTPFCDPHHERSLVTVTHLGYSPLFTCPELAGVSSDLREPVWSGRVHPSPAERAIWFHASRLLPRSDSGK
jgi:putative transposase